MPSAISQMTMALERLKLNEIGFDILRKKVQYPFGVFIVLWHIFPSDPGSLYAQQNWLYERLFFFLLHERSKKQLFLPIFGGERVAQSIYIIQGQQSSPLRK